MAFLATGDNEPQTHELLRELSHELIHVPNCTVENTPWIDSTGKPVALRIVQDGQPAYVVGRNTKPFKGYIVSTQRALIEKAWEQNKPLIMWIQGNYHIYDPQRILSEQIIDNTRFNEPMINFDYRVGRVWQDGESLALLWRIVQDGTRRFLRGRQTTLGGEIKL